MWFTENAWQPMLLLTLLAMMAGMVWSRRLQARYLITAIVLLLLVGVTWIVERSITTERERLHDSIVDMVTSFQKRDLENTVSYVSKGSDDLKFLIGSAHNVVEIRDDMRLTDIQVELTNRNSRAKTRFRVNGTAVFAATEYRTPTRWEASWQLEEGNWRMIDIIQLDPVSGEVLRDFRQEKEFWMRIYRPNG